MNFASFLAAAASSAETEGVIDRLQSYVESGDLSVAQQQLADPDYWSTVGIITLTGILMVFAILVILILLFSIMGKVFGNIDKNKKKQVTDKPTEAKVSEAPKTSAPAVEDFSTNDDEVIAVISAAIAAYSAQDGKSYQIKSIRRKDVRTRSAWSMAGIAQNTRPF